MKTFNILWNYQYWKRRTIFSNRLVLLMHSKIILYGYNSQSYIWNIIISYQKYTPLILCQTLNNYTDKSSTWHKWTTAAVLIKTNEVVVNLWCNAKRCQPESEQPCPIKCTAFNWGVSYWFSMTEAIGYTVDSNYMYFHAYPMCIHYRNLHFHPVCV